MTSAQSRTLNFIEDYIDRHGISPTYDEIAVGIGLASKSAAWRYVMQLQDKGVVHVSPSGSRGITVLKGRAKTLSEIISAARERFGDEAFLNEFNRQAGRAQ